LQLHVLCFDTNNSHRSSTSFTPVYRIERRFPDLQSILDEFDVESVEDIDVWGIDPGEVNPAAFCRLERQGSSQGSTGIATNSNKNIVDRAEDKVNNPVLPPSIVANNLVVSRLAMYTPTLAHRNHMNAIKEHRPVLLPGQNATPDVWARADLDRDKTGTSIPSIKDIENLVHPYQYESQQDCEMAIQWIIQVGPVLQGFYASNRIQKLNWELRKSKDAEMNLAIDAVLRTCTRKTLFCYGNGKFKTGLNLTSVHESFKDKFAQKVSLFEYCAFSAFPFGLQQKLTFAHMIFFYSIGDCRGACCGIGRRNVNINHVPNMRGARRTFTFSQADDAVMRLFELRSVASQGCDRSPQSGHCRRDLDSHTDPPLSSLSHNCQCALD